MQKKAKKAVDILNGRQFDAHYAENVEEARKLVETMLPDGAQIAVGDSVTLQETPIRCRNIHKEYQAYRKSYRK